MTELDERLAQALREAVPSPPRALDAVQVRAGAAGRHGRSRLVAPLLAAAAVVVVVLGVLYVVRNSGSGDSSHPPSRPPQPMFEVRPLLMPAVLLMGPRVTDDPFVGAPFPLPTTEAEYDRLTPREKLRLESALRRVDCANPPDLPDSSDRVACNGGYAALLGPPIVTGADIAAATAQPPSLPGGSTEWTVLLRFTKSGADSMRAWTAVHHTTEQGTPLQTDATPPCGVAEAVACSDFLAFVVDGRVLTAPVTHATLDEVVQFSAGFTEDTATRLAEQLAG